ncbi:alpha,alpha-trehalose-phosphate synthase (UDP-forming) [Sphingosinicella sp. BN140058]|uniref:alpha,alpha-trehalose-phosphate synthase (UDP-forming) n=1 Tax=Sphingosinicella sp. BN140058 TaxID=1892855 RepID=UPI001012DBC2|nr:alpha,alpha-trehalose-phosphate synthase (UDP-forming) [Sphingosinicella sp. BN140058]QAY75198.1 alpha,alpha-trehalose-phosphate synthase (UDP-forming) [Sphingosinicella sp. BN140058]
MSRLIVISNRVAAPKPDGEGGAQGGLAVALSAALREYRGLWFGWSGNRIEEFTGKIDFQRHDGVTSATVDLEEQDVEEYYNGYANRTLWPLFHYRIDLAEYDRSFGAGYERVNERFAETVTPLIEPDDLVWVHDYHLIPLGAQLRQRGLRNRIGFFLHIPWPPARLLTSLPAHEHLVLSLLAYDVIGFHTQEWLESFQNYVERELGGHCEPDGTIHVGERSVHAAAYPIGIDYKEFREAAESDAAWEAFERLRKSADGRGTIIGVDRLDYSKGLEERFLGYRRFLEEHRDWQGEVFLLQIAPPSRGEVHTYEKIRETLDELSGRINGEFAAVDWVPIRYVNQGYGREDLAGFYRASQIALVTPLRDGMNLVAKEYVAAQDPEDPGVLILSRFAGAALQLKDALLVNPYSKEEISDAIKQALDMPRDERIRRWRSMNEIVKQEDVVWWRRNFVAALEGKGDGAQQEAQAAG